MKVLRVEIQPGERTEVPRRELFESMDEVMVVFRNHGLSFIAGWEEGKSVLEEAKDGDW